MPVTWYEGIVKKIAPLAPGVQRYWLDVPAVEKFDFEPGQFITLDLPLGEKRLQRWRSYSIANAPDGSQIIELCIVRSLSGEGSGYLFDQVTVGSSLRFKGPEGAFVLPPVIEKDLVFICTGTGIAPFRSMIQHIKNTGQSYRNLHLIFGTRTAESILYRAEFDELSRTFPNFKYDIALSRQPDWSGYQGHVHQIYLEQYRDVRADVSFYLCGWSNMIDEAVANLLITLKYDRSQIHYELYG